MGWQLLMLGRGGQAGDDGHVVGTLHGVLASIGIDDLWKYSFTVVGAAMVQCALIAFLWGRSWDHDLIRRFNAARRLAALCAVFLWMIALYLQVVTALPVFRGPARWVPVHLAMAFYIFYETTRAHYVFGTWRAGQRVR